MKFVTINTTSYNKDSIIGVEMPTRDVNEEEPTGKWFYIVYIKDAIEEIVEFETAEDCIKSRSELMLQLENNYYEKVSIDTEDVFQITGCMDENELIKCLKELAEEFKLDATCEIHDETFTVPLIDQIRNKLLDLDGLEGWSDRLAKAILYIEECLNENKLDEIKQKIMGLPLDDYRF